MDKQASELKQARQKVWYLRRAISAVAESPSAVKHLMFLPAYDLQAVLQMVLTQVEAIDRHLDAAKADCP